MTATVTPISMPSNPAPAARAMFQRAEGFDMQVGRILVFHLQIAGFTIVVHRMGVAFRGAMPILNTKGVREFGTILEKCAIHHEHLAATYAAGGQQSYLDESEVEAIFNGIRPRPQMPESQIDTQGAMIVGP